MLYEVITLQFALHEVAVLGIVEVFGRVGVHCGTGAHVTALACAHIVHELFGTEIAECRFASGQFESEDISRIVGTYGILDEIKASVMVSAGLGAGLGSDLYVELCSF